MSVIDCEHLLFSEELIPFGFPPLKHWWRAKEAENRVHVGLEFTKRNELMIMLLSVCWMSNCVNTVN